MPNMQEKKGRRVSKAPEVRRRELLEAAATLFGEKGVSATGIGDITDHAQVARGTFYLYFSSKDELVSELWQRYVAGFMALIDARMESSGGKESGEFVLDLLELLTEHALDHAHLHRTIYGTADAAAIALCRQSDEAILIRLTEAIGNFAGEDGQGVGDIALTASLLFNALDGALHNAIMKDQPIDRPAFIGGVRQFAARTLGLSGNS